MKSIKIKYNSNLHPDLKQELKDYIENGKRPENTFLLKVLENNLAQAYNYGVEESGYKLKDWAEFITDQLPSMCYGSIERVNDYCEMRHKYYPNEIEVEIEEVI